MKKNSFTLGQLVAQKVMALTLAVIMCLAGCGGDKKNGKASPTTNNPDGSSGKSQKSTGGATGSSPDSKSGLANPNQQKVGDAPAVALQRMFSGLANGQPVALWDALPKSYQNDLNDLVKAGVFSIDPQVRNKFFEVLGKTAAVLTEKKALIVPALQGMPEANKPGTGLAVVLSNYDNISALAATLAKSELASPAWQQNPDIGTLLSGAGGKLVEQGLSLASIADASKPAAILSELKSAKVKMGQPLRTNQRVIITTTREVTTNIVMQVEGKWLPSIVLLKWKPEISQMKARVVAQPMNAETKQIALRGMDVLAGALLSIEQAQDAQQMGQAIGDLMRVSKMLGGGEEPVKEQLPAGRRNAWNYGAGDLNTRIDAFINQPQTGVEQVLGPPDSRVPSQNPQQVSVYWLYLNMQINDLTKNTRATKVYFGIKNGKVVSVLVAP